MPTYTAHNSSLRPICSSLSTHTHRLWSPSSRPHLVLKPITRWTTSSSHTTSRRKARLTPPRRLLARLRWDTGSRSPSMASSRWATALLGDILLPKGESDSSMALTAAWLLYVSLYPVVSEFARPCLHTRMLSIREAVGWAGPAKPSWGGRYRTSPHSSILESLAHRLQLPPTNTPSIPLTPGPAGHLYPAAAPGEGRRRRGRGVFRSRRTVLLLL